MDQPRRNYAFLSYRSIERIFAVKLSTALRKAGGEIWVDCLPEGIRPGDDWPFALEDALNRCHSLIPVVSPAYVQSEVCLRELHRADQLGRPIFPLLIAPVAAEEWPLEIERLQYVDFTGWHDDKSFETALARLIARMSEAGTEIIGRRPNLERQYLLSLIADLEMRGGVNAYLQLGVQLRSTPRQADLPESVTRKWGLDSEFLMLESQTVPDKERRAPVSEAKPIDNLLDLIRDERRFVLLGEPGAGKTTSLLRLALETARSRLNDPQNTPFPLVLRLPEWVTDSDPLTFVRSHWPLGGTPQDAIKNGDVIVFLDGLNEIGDQTSIRAERLKQWLHSGDAPKRLVVTCRAQDYPAIDLGIDKVTIQPMNRDRIERFVQLYLPDDAADFLGRIGREFESRSLFGLATNPYLLTSLLLLYRQSPRGDLPRNPGVLFRRLIVFLWNRELHRQTSGWVPFEKAEACLAQVAFQMIEEGRPTVVPIDYVNHILDDLDDLHDHTARNPRPALGPHPILHVALHASILSGEGESVRFYHQLIQEYFAAVRLSHVGVGERYKKQSWREVIVSLSGIVSDPDTLIRDLASSDLNLAARCITTGAIVSAETRRLVLDRLLHSYEQALKLQNEKLTEMDKQRDDYLTKHPDLSWSSRQMMEDALENYFEKPYADEPQDLKRLIAEGGKDWLEDAILRSEPDRAAVAKSLLQDLLSEEATASRLKERTRKS